MNFVYMPVRGPLSGASFEAQTVAFFEALQTNFNTALDAVNRNLQAIQMNIVALQKQANDNTSKIATLSASLALQTQRIDKNEKDIADLTTYAQMTRQMLGETDIRVAALENGQTKNSSDIEELKRGVNSLEKLTSEQEQAIAGLDRNMQQRIEEITALQATTSELKGREEPEGAICLCMDEELPESWLECNGNNGMPDLSGFVTAPLRFIRKRVAEENPDESDPDNPSPENPDPEHPDTPAEPLEPENKDQSPEQEVSENTGGNA